eukprot:c11011_g1_i1.p1 GENE.c11011_g1_i1~~c11011_g1_i1.p1  ORF type:complete len:423 (-),score=82.84 c11011_g1_i1:32-1300(-)
MPWRSDGASLNPVWLDSPEQVRALSDGAWGTVADMFGLGLVLSELITGRQVSAEFPRRSIGEWTVGDLRDVVLPNCPGSLLELANQLLGPADYRPTRGDVEEWLLALLEDMAVDAKQPLSEPELAVATSAPTHELVLCTEPPTAELITLREAMLRCPDLSQRARVKILAELAGVLTTLHGEGIVLNQLDAGQLFVAPGWRLQLRSFEFACREGVVRPGDPVTASTCPNRLRGECACGPACDMFSFGMVLLEVMTGYEVTHRFPGRNANFFPDPNELQSIFAPTCPVSVRGLAAQLLSEDPYSRPESDAAKDWLECVFDDMKEPIGLEQYNPWSPAASTPTRGRSSSIKAPANAGAGAICLPYAVLRQILQKKEYGELGLDPTAMERYLSPTEFRAVFGMDVTTFDLMPYWKRKKAKVEVHLF